MTTLLDSWPKTSVDFTFGLSQEEAKALDEARWSLHARSLREISRFLIVEALRARGYLAHTGDGVYPSPARLPSTKKH